MIVAPVMRLFGFRPTRPAFDNVVRDWILPAICDRPGVIEVHAGRHGPDELGPRLIVSIWESRAAMDVALGGSARPGAFRPEELDGMAERTAEILPVEVVFRAADAVRPPRIIRILRGSVRLGRLAAYLKEARAGVAADVAAGHGPLAFYLAHGASTDTFLALSVWASWPAIELATGGDVKRPMATRHPELIAAWDATHYEAIGT